MGSIITYLADPSNLPEIWPSLLEVTDVQLLPEGAGSNYRWVYKMAGMRFKGRTEIIEYVTNKILTWKDSGEGKLESVRRCTFEPTSNGAKVTWEIEYTIPIPVLGKLAEKVIMKLNENEADIFAANLKARMEAD